MNDFSHHPIPLPAGARVIIIPSSPPGERTEPALSNDDGVRGPRFDIRSWITRDIGNSRALQARKYIVSSKKVNKIIPLLSKIGVVF
jgi:hypothetical protein